MVKSLRLLLHWFLALAVFAAAPAFARGPAEWRSSPEDVQRIIRNAEGSVLLLKGQRPAFTKEEILRRIKRGELSLDGKAKKPSFLMHNAETMMQLWILAWVHGVYQQQKMKPLADKDSGLIHSIIESGLVSGDQLANSFSTYASLLGGVSATYALKKPLDAIGKGLAAAGTRQSLVKLISSGAFSYVSYTGWVAGETLIEEATYSLDEAEIVIAKDLRFLDLLAGTGTQEQYRVFAKMMKNAFLIMTFVHPETTNEWIYNTWRLKVGTGPFFTTLFTMVSFGVTAGAFAPGEGTLIMFCFGVVGGVIGGGLAMVIPDAWNDAITDKIRAARVDAGYARLDQNSFLLTRYQDYAHRQGNVELNGGFEGYVKLRGPIRNDIATALIEQIYGAYLKIQEADVILGLVKAKTPVNFVRGAAFDNFLNPDNLTPVAPGELPTVQVENLGNEFIEQKKVNTERLKFFFDQLLELQKNEAVTLGAFAYDTSTTFPDALKMEALAAIADQQTEHLGLRQMYVGLLPEKAKDYPEMKELSAQDLQELQAASHILLNLCYLRAYDEKYFQ
ncbi:MAG: hypothetical protein ACXVA9_08395 [Bdellovibrionales bacterium]